MAQELFSGLFIVFEGIDGSGKTSQANRLRSTMAAMGYDILMTQEPQKKSTKVDESRDMALGAWVRTQLLHQSAKKWDNLAMIYMLLAARVDHIRNTILPALQMGKVVICDRFSYSTLAYQGYGMGGDIEMIKKLSAPIDAIIKPDRVFLIDIAPQAAMLRLDSGREKKDMIEEKPIEFFEKVRLGFLEIADEHRRNMVVIDGLQPEDVVAAAVEKNIIKLLKK
ncbi:MAG: dTMP kinase [Hydrotalea sp.]|nr:dTMP kinase [Hydrotalea sp.]